MKSFGFFALMLFVTLTARAELDTLWSRNITMDPTSYAIGAAIVLRDGQVMAASGRGSTAAIDLWRFDRQGELAWNGTVFLQGQYINVLGMDEYADGQIAMIGQVWSDGDSSNILVVVRVNNTGTLLGQDTYNMPVSNFNSRLGVCATRDNHLLVFTAQYDLVTGSYTDLLLKFDSDGDSLWSRRIDTEQSGWGMCVKELPNGDLILAGTALADNFAFEGFITRASANGDMIWENTYTSEAMGQLMPNSLEIGINGNIYAGGTEGQWFGFSQPWAVCLSPDGDEVWTLSGIEDSFLSVTGIRPTEDGGAMISGSSSGEVIFSGEIHLISPTGEAGPSELQAPGEDLRGMHTHDRGSVIFGTYSDANQFYGKIYRVGPGFTATGFVRAQGTNEPLPGIKVEMVETGEFTLTDSQGIYLLGASQANGTLRASSPCIASATQTVELVEGEVTVVDYTVGLPQYENHKSSINIIGTFGRWERDTLTIYNDGSGALSFSAEAIEYTPTYGWLFVAPATGEIAAGSSAQIVVSTLTNPNHPESEFLGDIVIHHNACPDTMDEVGVYILALDTPENPSLVETFAVHPAYPNPFNNSARVSFDIPRAAHVTAKLYSIEGREVATLVDDALPAGSHGLLVDGANFATGVYLLRVSAGEFVNTQKLVLLK